MRQLIKIGVNKNKRLGLLSYLITNLNNDERILPY